MITEDNIDRIDKILAEYAKQDYLRANPPRGSKGFHKNYTPYTLSSRTREALEMLRTAYKRENATHEEEVAVKDYLLKHKLLADQDE